MNIKQIITVGVAGMAIGAMALDNVEVTDVKARQRYPWNGKVDIDFTLDSKPTEPYQMQVEVYDNVGKTNLPVKSVCTEGVSAEANPCMVRTDTRRIVWDAAKDLPNGFKCTNVLVSCQDDRLIAESNRYMIVELSSGAISYTNCPPRGGWTEEHMTTKMVLRRIAPQTFFMGSPASDVEHTSNETLHRVTLTKPYYIGIFEVTVKQFALICGCSGDDTQPVFKTWADIRGYDTTNGESGSIDGVTFTVTPDNVVTDYCWPNTDAVDDESFIGKLRTRTNLPFDLPTEAQWECACRAGTSAPLNVGFTNSVINKGLIQGEKKSFPSGSGYQYVGNYMPNSLGVYDMNGNAAEWCLDVYRENLGTADVLDPIGDEVNFDSIELINDRSEPYGTYLAAVSYSGKSYLSNGSGNYFYSIRYDGSGVRRVVRGINERVASRTSALNLNNTGTVFNTGIIVGQFEPGTQIGPGPATIVSVYHTFKASYDNPKHGMRIALVVEE